MLEVRLNPTDEIKIRNKILGIKKHAQKEYKCDGCGEKIQPKTDYVYWFSEFYHEKCNEEFVPKILQTLINVMRKKQYTADK